MMLLASDKRPVYSDFSTPPRTSNVRLVDARPA